MTTRTSTKRQISPACAPSSTRVEWIHGTLIAPNPYPISDIPRCTATACPYLHPFKIESSKNLPTKTT